MNAQTPDPDQVLPYLVVNTGGHPIARFTNEDHARQYSAGWLGLLPPINTASGATVADAVAQWRAKQQAETQPSDGEWQVEDHAGSPGATDEVSGPRLTHGVYGNS